MQVGCFFMALNQSAQFGKYQLLDKIAVGGNG